jgi:hypothetical protein
MNIKHKIQKYQNTPASKEFGIRFYALRSSLAAVSAFDGVRKA